MPSKTIGTRAEVFHGTADHTSGGLKKNDLKLNDRGRIVSKKASATASKINRLEKLGFKTEPGEFRLFKKSDGKRK